MTDDEDWELYSFVKRSTQRTKVLKALDGPTMPKEIAKDTDLHQSHVSRALNEMQDEGLVELLNPEDKHGRLYRRTDDGQHILDKIEENEDE